VVKNMTMILFYKFLAESKGEEFLKLAEIWQNYEGISLIVFDSCHSIHKSVLTAHYFFIGFFE